MVSVRNFSWLALLASGLCGQFFLNGNESCAAEDAAEIHAGEELFKRDWSKHDPAQDGPTGSDGLGPLFNAVSCVACHSQGGTGGGGANKHNLKLLSLVRMREKEKQQQPVFDHNRRPLLVTHPNLKQHASTVLHLASKHPEYQARIESLLRQPSVVVLGASERDLFRGLAAQGIPALREEQELIAALRTERNTPSLFGVGLIDAIHPQRLLENELKQRKKYPEMAGELPPRLGRFGWRGQIGSLREFVQAACANELGLQTEGFAQASDTLSEKPAPILPKFDADGNPLFIPDMFPSEVDALVRYVEQLPPPPQIMPKTSAERFVWTRGKRHFYQVQCEVCHQERIGMVKGIYSDLLLHDLGPELWDPVSLGQNRSGAYAQLIQNARSGGVGSSAAAEHQWRTPPLWGVRDSAPYLHDGRAVTIEEAILAHSGQADSSRRMFLRLSPPAQRELITFVESLGAPPGENILARLERKHRAEMAASKPELETLEQQRGALNESPPVMFHQTEISFNQLVEPSLVQLPADTIKFFRTGGAKP